MYIPLLLASFTQYNVFKFHLYYSIISTLLVLLSNNIPCMGLLHFVYPFISWTFVLLPFLAVTNSAAMNIHVQVFVWTYVFSFQFSWLYTWEWKGWVI